MSRHSIVTTLAFALSGAAPAAADSFTWTGFCGNSSWTASCADGPCNGGLDQLFRNNWGRQECGTAPPVPGAGDSATINAGVVDLPSALTLAELTIGGGGELRWEDALLSATTVTNGGLIVWEAGSPTPNTFANGTLTNNATIDGTATGARLDNATLLNSGTINLDGVINETGTPLASLVENTGTIEGTGGIDVRLENAGTIRAAGGTLNVSGDRVVSTGGFFEADSGSTLRLANGGGIELSGTFLGAPAGTLEIDSDWSAFTPVTLDVQGTGVQWLEQRKLSTPGTSVTNAGTGILTILDRVSAFPAVLDGVLINNGFLISNANLDFTGGTLENNSLFNIRDGVMDDESGTNLIDNAGEIRKTTTAIARIEVPIETTGEVRVEEGELRIRGPILSTLAQFNVLAPGTLDFGGATLTGTFSGQVAGSVGASGDWGVSSQDAVLDFDGPGFDWNGGDLTVATGGTLTNATAALLTVRNLGDRFIHGALQNNGTLIYDTTSPLRFEDATLSNGNELELRGSTWTDEAGTNLLDNGGLLRKTTGSNANIEVPLKNGGEIRVEAGSLLLSGPVAGVNTGGGISSTSFGTFTATAGGELRFSSDAIGGALGGSPAGVVRSSGNWGIAPGGATFSFSGNGFRWNGSLLTVPNGTALTNTAAGLLTIEGSARLTGQLTNEGALVVDATRIDFEGGRVVNNGQIDHRDGLWNDDSGVNLFENHGMLEKTGTTNETLEVDVINTGLIVARAGVLNLTGTVTSSGGTWSADSGGTLRLFGVTLGGDFSGAPTGAVELGSTVTVDGGGATLAFTNEGLLWPASAVEVDPSATLTNASGGLLRLTGTSTTGRRLAGTLVNAGTLRHDGSSWLDFDEATVVNNGLVELRGRWDFLGGTNAVTNNGTLRNLDDATIEIGVTNTGLIESTVDALAFDGGLTQTAGELRLAGGDLEAASPISLQGGRLTGGGTIDGAVDNPGGTVAPGSSAGTITLDDAAYAQGSGGTLVIELGGTTPDSEHDVLVLTGAAGDADLDGTLALRRLNGYTPTPGSSHTILTADSVSGGFSTVTAPAGWTVSVQVNAADVTVVVTSIEEVGDLDQDGDVDADDADLFAGCLAGPGVTTPPVGCDPNDFARADLDSDGDVDLVDWAKLQRSFTGSL